LSSFWMSNGDDGVQNMLG